MLAVATGRPFRVAVKLGVGDSYLAGSSPTRDDELAADEGDLDVVDPDLVGTVKSDRIASPDILRVEILHTVSYTGNHLRGKSLETYCNVDVLDDLKGPRLVSSLSKQGDAGNTTRKTHNIALSTTDTKSFANNDALGANANKTLVAVDINGGFRSVIVSAVNPGATGSIAGILDPGLALGSTTGTLGRAIITAALAAGRALSFAKVPSAIDHDGSGRAVGKPLLKSAEI